MKDGLAVRLAAREGRLAGPTAGLAPGFVQGNVVILPAAMAEGFDAYCRLNPKPCPLVARSQPGDPRLPELADDLDIRTDVPAYRVFRNGADKGIVTAIAELWRDDLVTFVLGCSFSFEEALIREGLAVRHIEEGCNVPMYRTSVMTVASGPFRGPMVVSMRPYRPADLPRVVEVTGRYGRVHGAPVHAGDPPALGIRDLGRPDFGDAVTVRQDEIPVFWACGATPLYAIANARPDLAVMHAPGCMLVTDLLNEDLAA